MDIDTQYRVTWTGNVAGIASNDGMLAALLSRYTYTSYQYPALTE